MHKLTKPHELKRRWDRASGSAKMVAYISKNENKINKLDNSGGEGISGTFNQNTWQALIDMVGRCGHSFHGAHLLDLGAGTGMGLFWLTALMYKTGFQIPSRIVGVELNDNRFFQLVTFWQSMGAGMGGATLTTPLFLHKPVSAVKVADLCGPQQQYCVFSFDKGFTMEDKTDMYSRFCCSDLMRFLICCTPPADMAHIIGSQLHAVSFVRGAQYGSGEGATAWLYRRCTAGGRCSEGGCRTSPAFEQVKRPVCSKLKTLLLDRINRLQQHKLN
jgi:hypothetical protein